MFIWLRNTETKEIFKLISRSEEVGEQLSNKVEEVYSLNSMVGEENIKRFQGFSRALGLSNNYTLYSQFIDVWTGSEKRTVSVEARLVASWNSEDEVFIPIRKIQQWSMPRKGKYTKDAKFLGEEGLGLVNVLSPPIINLKIGEELEKPLIHIRKGIITSCRPEWKGPFDSHGYPIHSDLQLTINDTEIQTSDLYRVSTDSFYRSRSAVYKEGWPADVHKGTVAGKPESDRRGIPKLDKKTWLKEKLKKRWLEGRQSYLGTAKERIWTSTTFKR